MIYLGPAGIPLQAKSSEEGIAILRKEKLNAMEVQFTYGVRTKPETAEEIGRLASKNGIKLSTHAPYYINLNSLSKETVKKSRTWIYKTAELCDIMGARIIAFHPGFYHGMEKRVVERNIHRQLKIALRKIEKEGWDVLLGLELTGKRSAWGAIEDIVEMSKRLDGTIPVIDFAHHHARLGGVLKRRKDFEYLFSKYEEVERDILHCHVSCIEYTEKGERNHLPLKSKEPDYKPAIPLFKRKKYDIVLISESPLLDKDSLVMKDMLRI